MPHPSIRLGTPRNGMRQPPPTANEPRRKRAVPERDKKGRERQKLVGGWWLELVVVWLSLLGRVAKDRRLVFTSACSGAREDPPELGRLIAARRCLDSAHLSLVPGANQLEDHTRWTGPRQVLVFSSSSPSELEALIKTTVGPILLGVCVCVFVVPV